MEQKLNLSIVVPTNGRVNLVKRLLQSLVPEREAYPYGETEVLIVNSGKEEDAALIKELCEKYQATFIPGENNVRKKRNLGIEKAQYEVVLFLDSDVAAEKDLLKFHAEGFLNAEEKNLGGIFGLTKFVGRKTWWWKVVEQTTYLDSFSFAEKFPYNAWTIANNVSFYRKILLEVGKFEVNFPFPLGGDDLDLTYRITKSGYLIKSCPQAVTLHSTETWNHPKAIYDRTHRWGSMDYFLSQRHPEIFVDCIPKSGVLFAAAFLAGGILSAAFRSFLPVLGVLFWLLLHVITVYIYDCVHKEGGNPFYYALGKIIRCFYRLYYYIAGFKKHDIRCLHKEMSFSLEQTKYMQRREIAVFCIYLITFAVMLLGVCIVKLI
ncbi:MAG: glycosyltransferase [Acutalibacteraceae bacterium]